MNFKEQMQRDLERVFHNPNEFAEEKVFYYDGKRFKAPVILDHCGAADRKQLLTDHAPGIFLADLTLYVPLEYMTTTPRKGGRLEIDGNYYTIVKVESENGEIILYLEMYDE